MPLNFAPLVREISWSNNIAIMENAKMICGGNCKIKDRSTSDTNGCVLGVSDSTSFDSRQIYFRAQIAMSFS